MPSFENRVRALTGEIADVIANLKAAVAPIRERFEARCIDVELIARAWREWRDVRLRHGEAYRDWPPPFFIRDELGLALAADEHSIRDTYERREEIAAYRAHRRALRVAGECELGVKGDDHGRYDFMDVFVWRGSTLQNAAAELDGQINPTKTFWPHDEIDWSLPDGGRGRPTTGHKMKRLLSTRRHAIAVGMLRGESDAEIASRTDASPSEVRAARKRFRVPDACLERAKAVSVRRRTRSQARLVAEAAKRGL